MNRLNSFRLIISLILSLAQLAATAVGQDDARVAKAKAFFERYVKLEREFDPAAADLYDDDAVIENARRYPNGEVRVIRIPVARLKQLIVKVMPVAKARRDTNTYSRVSYKLEGSRVRIKATRYSELKKYSSPVSLLVGEGPGGEWLIYEDYSESRP